MDSASVMPSMTEELIIDIIRSGESSGSRIRDELSVTGNPVSRTKFFEICKSSIFLVEGQLDRWYLSTRGKGLQVTLPDYTAHGLPPQDDDWDRIHSIMITALRDIAAICRTSGNRSVKSFLSALRDSLD